MGRVVHVGGTNGKGSTCAFLEAALRHAGYRTGLYTSPHLMRFTERIRVGGEECAPEALAERYERMCQRLPRDLELTFFERATLLALCTFADEKTDVTVLEVGLGGRLDATNALDDDVADVAVVTGIALDHQEILGSDLAAIAVEKAGIFKVGQLAIVGASGDEEGRAVLRREAERRGVREVCVAPADVKGLRLGLLGQFQRRNAACAWTALEALERQTAVHVPDDVRRSAFAAARWPGRLEELPLGDARLWLDGAHNPDATRALAQEITEQAARRVLCVVGVSKDKDVGGILAPVLPHASAVCATTAGSDRALAAGTLADFMRGPGRQVVVEADPHAAIAWARREANAGDLVVVFGSLFLVGEVRAHLLGEPTDPIALQDPRAKNVP